MSLPLLKKMPIVALAFSTLLLHGYARATDVNVACPGSTGKTFHSINDALKTLDLVGPHTITVTGTCHENVALTQRDRLTIRAMAGQYATISAADPAAITLYIAGSHNIVLDHLIIQGGSPAMYVSAASSPVYILDCTVQNSLSDGLDIDQESVLTIQNSTITNNSAAGIFISNQSQLTLATYPDQSIRITSNGFGGNGNGTDGLAIDGSQVQLNFGVLTVDGNQGAGISMDGGRLQLYGGTADSPGLIENNNTGLAINDAASATLWSAFRIRKNASTGIAVNGASSITFFDGPKNAATTVEGHSTVGLTLSQSSSAQIYGAHSIVNNGSANADHDARGGISLEGSSLTIGGGTSVSNNVGPGVRLSVKSDLIMSDMTVSNNTEEGVRETNLSGGGFYNPLTFTGNGGNSLYCDKFSVAFGDAGSIQGANCPNITQTSGRRPTVRIPRMR